MHAGDLLTCVLQVLSLVVVLAHAQGEGGGDGGDGGAGGQDAGMPKMNDNDGPMKKLMDQMKKAGTKMSGKAKDGMGQMKQGATKMSGKAKEGMGQMKKQMGDGQKKMQGGAKQAATEAPSMPAE